MSALRSTPSGGNVERVIPRPLTTYAQYFGKRLDSHSALSLRNCQEEAVRNRSQLSTVGDYTVLCIAQPKTRPGKRSVTALDCSDASMLDMPFSGRTVCCYTFRHIGGHDGAQPDS